MIFNKSEYNPFPAIKAMAEEVKRDNYNQAFLDYVRKQLFMGGVVPESAIEAAQMLKVLTEMEII